MLERFGKPSAEVMRLKRSFFDSNDALLEENERLADIYRRQPRRTHCKNCGAVLEGPSFEKFGIGYVICQEDGHLNGAFEDTDEYCEAVYLADDGRNYGATYLETSREGYERRLEAIYIPKVDFLSSSLGQLGHDPASLNYVEFGAGSGYMLRALEDRGVRAIGYDISPSQSSFANTVLGRRAVITHAPHETLELGANVAADVVIMIGTLEHLQNPRGMMHALSSNRAVRFVFVSLPLFSPSVFFEALFPHVMQRHLAGGHTHLYTRRSIDHLCEEYGFAQRTAWWFGTDVMDLYRMVVVSLRKNDELAELESLWEEMFAPSVDDLQESLDQRRVSSQVHLVLERAR